MAKKTKPQLKADLGTNYTRTTNSIRNTTVIGTNTDLIDSLEHVDNTVVTPADLSGQKGKIPKVNSAESGLEFIEEPVSATKANVANTISAGDNITIADDPNDSTKTRISATQRGAPTKAEVEAVVSAGDNITIDDDPNDSTKARISATQRGAPTQGEVYTQVKAILQDGTNITTDEDDTNNQLTLNSTATGGTTFNPSVDNLAPVLTNIIKEVGGNVDQYSPEVTSNVNNISGRALDTSIRYSTVTTSLMLFESTSGTSITNTTALGTFTLAQINALPANYTAGGDIYTRQEDIDDGGNGSNANAISFTTGGRTFYLLKGNNGNIWVFLVNASTITRYFIIRTPGTPSNQLRDVATTDATVDNDFTDSDYAFIEDGTDGQIKKVLKTDLRIDTGFQFTDTTTESIADTAEIPYFDNAGNRRNISVSDLMTSLGLEAETYSNLGVFTLTSVTTGTTFRSTSINPTLYDEKTYDITFVPATTAQGNPLTNPDTANRSTYRDTGENLKSALQTRTVGTNSVLADLTLTDQGAARTIRLAQLADGTILIDPQNWPGILTVRVADHISRSTDLPDMPDATAFAAGEDGQALVKNGDAYELSTISGGGEAEPVYEELISQLRLGSSTFDNISIPSYYVFDEKTYRITFTPAAENDRANSGTLVITGEDLRTSIRTIRLGTGDSQAINTNTDVLLNNDGADRTYAIARLTTGNDQRWGFASNPPTRGTWKVEIEKEITRLGDLVDTPTINTLSDAAQNTGLIRNASGVYESKLVFPAPSFYVTSQSTLSSTQYTKVITEDDFGRIVGINPGSRTVWVVFPDSLPLDFSCSVISDNGNNGLIRIGCNNMIDRSTNTANLLRQGRSQTTSQSLSTYGFPVSLGGNNYSGFDWVDLWWANDELEFTKVNNANWYRVAIKRYIAFEPPLNPTTSGVQSLGRATTSFSHSYRSVSVTKFKQVWQAN